MWWDQDLRLVVDSGTGKSDTQHKAYSVSSLPCLLFSTYRYAMIALMVASVTLVAYLALKRSPISAPLVLPLPIYVGYHWIQTERLYREPSSRVTRRKAMDNDQVRSNPARLCHHCYIFDKITTTHTLSGTITWRHYCKFWYATISTTFLASAVGGSRAIYLHGEWGNNHKTAMHNEWYGEETEWMAWFIRSALSS